MAGKKIDWEQRLYETALRIYTKDDSTNAENSIEEAANFIKHLQEYEEENNI